MVRVFKLAYLDFACRDVSRLTHYYTEVMGYVQTDRGEDGTVYLSNGVDHHNIVLTPSDRSGWRVTGLQVDPKISLDDAEEILKKRGIAVKRFRDAKPGIADYLEIADPDGNLIHLFTHMDMPVPGFSRIGIVPQKLGHMAFYSKDFQKTVNFYVEVLGFAFTDKIGEAFCNFLTCNNDHHVLNVVASNQGNRLHHVAFQLKDASHQYLSNDILAKHNIPIYWGPSRHYAGHNISTYSPDPEENIVELFIDMDQYIWELGIFEPRPWHEELPLKPKIWEGLSAWGTEYDFDLATLRMKQPVEQK